MRTENRKQKAQSRKQRWILLVLLICSFSLLAQQTTVKDFSVPEYFDAPHETQVKSLLEGAEAEPGSNGMVLIRKAKIQTFTETGAPQMTVRAPLCFFDTKQQTVSSTGRFELETSDSKLALEGQGFFFQRTNSNLIISNQVRTQVRGPLTNTFAP